MSGPSPRRRSFVVGFAALAWFSVLLQCCISLLTAAENGKLALERARAVATFIEAQGIPASRLTVRGAGDPGRTQAFNRLVIISVTEPASSAP